MSYVVKKSSLKKEFKSTTVRDKRQIKSLQRISECVEKNQGKSYSSSCGKSLRQNGGRIFGDKKMNIENMQNGHYKETIKRVKNENILLLPQDTSTLNYSGHVATTGLGCIGTTKDMQGLLMHTMMILNTDGFPLGIIGQKIWARDDNDFGKKHRRKKLNIKDKESYKWIEGMQWAFDRLASKLKKSTEIWVIGDKESDIYELISQDKPDNVKLLIRAYQPRRVEVEKDNTYKKLTEFIEDLPENTTKTVELERENRTEKIELVVS